MTFLNPLVLFGLVAAAIPVILHLLNLRKLRTIEFSTLTFLKELQQTKIRRLKLRQILLLIVRTLLIIFIILSFARPALRGTMVGDFGSHARSTIVIILDDSFSMSASNEHGELFKQAKESVGKLIDLAKTGDEAFLIRLSEVPRATVDPATHDFTALRTIVNEAQISPVRRRVSDALALAAGLLKRSSNVNKEIYLVSDLQRTLFTARNENRTGGSTSLLDEHTKLFLVPIGSKESPNAAIDSVEVTTTILEQDKPANLYVSVRNFGNTPLNNSVLSAYLDGAKAAQSNVSLEAWGSASATLVVTPKHTGHIKGYVELEHDAIDADNRRFFSLYIPERISVVIASNSAADNQFALIALRAGMGEGKQSLLKIQETTPQNLSLVNFKSTDVIVLSNVPSLSIADAERVHTFVNAGGGLVIFPGQDVDINNYNSGLFRSLEIPPIERVTKLPAGDAGLSFQKLDLEHPLFATVFEKDQPGQRTAKSEIESPAVTQSWVRKAGIRGRTVIGLSDGSAFLSEHTVGTGRVLVYSVAPTLSWSDFPLKAVFAPLIYRSMIYVSPREGQQHSFLAGSEPSIAITNRSMNDSAQTAGGDGRFRLISPDGVEELIQPSIQQNTTQTNPTRGLTFTPKSLTLPGIYEVKRGTNTLELMTVNTDPQESDTRKMSAADVQSYWQQIGIEPAKVQYAEPGEQLQTTIIHARLGVELWKFCIGLALLMALVEMVIARDSRKALQQA